MNVLGTVEAPWPQFRDEVAPDLLGDEQDLYKHALAGVAMTKALLMVRANERDQEIGATVQSVKEALVDAMRSLDS